MLNIPNRMNELEETIALVARDDREAFHRLFYRYHSHVFHFIRSLVKEDASAEDLAQEVFIKVWTHRESLTMVQSFEAYLFRIARNAVKDHVKGLAVRAGHLNRYSLRQERALRFEEEFIAQESERIIREIVGRMPEQRRKIFEMSRYKGMKNEEIARELGITKKTVENHINAALKEVRQMLPLLLLLAAGSL